MIQQIVEILEDDNIDLKCFFACLSIKSIFLTKKKKIKVGNNLIVL